MPKVDIGFAAWDALDHYMNRYKEITATEMGKRLGVTPQMIGRWRNSPFAQVDPEKINLIKEICAETWPSPSQIEELEEGWDGTVVSETRGIYSKERKSCVSFDDDEYFKNPEPAEDLDLNAFWAKQRRIKAAQKKKRVLLKQISVMEKKYALPELPGNYMRGIRYDKIIELSKNLSMHLPDIIEKYPQCREIIFNQEPKYWNDKSDVSIVELAKIPKEDFNQNDDFDVFSKHEQDIANAPGCAPVAAVILFALFFLVILSS